MKGLAYNQKGRYKSLVAAVLVFGLTISNLLLSIQKVARSEKQPSHHQETLATIRGKCIDAIRSKQTEALFSLIRDHKSVLLVDPAYHENVGDTLIVNGEKTFLKHFTLTECGYLQSLISAIPCEEVLSFGTNATIAIWQGGGNWGDLCLPLQDLRIKSFVDLLQYGLTIIGFPQSLYYRNSTFAAIHANQIKQNIKKGLYLNELESAKNLKLARSKVIFTWREHYSFEQAKHLYPFVDNRLVPDIAFQLGPFSPIPPEPTVMVDVLLFLRSDSESKLGTLGRTDENIQQSINQISPGQNLTFKVVDWNDRFEMFGSNNFFFDDASLKLVSFGRVVIVDRLHGAILTYLANVPVIYFDQETNKLTKVLDVAFETADICKDEKNMIIRTASLNEALAKAKDLLAASRSQIY